MHFPAYLACREGEDGTVFEKEDARGSRVTSFDNRQLPASKRETDRNVTEPLAAGQPNRGWGGSGHRRNPRSACSLSTGHQMSNSACAVGIA